jgi:chromosomal replication initiation ATPase DnaA
MAPAAALRYVPAPVVLEQVAGYFGLTVDALRGPCLLPSLTFARGIAALLLSELTTLSQREVGIALGRAATRAGLDLLASARRKREEDERFAPILEQLRERLLQGDDHAA